MLRILLGIMVLLGSSGLLADGNAANGQDLVAVCGACHGQDGNSPAGAFPSLAGQGEKYLYKQMVDIKDGRRSAVTMTGLLDGYSDQQIMDIAAYYASQQTKVGAASADLVALGEKVYRAGIARKNIAACTACHSPNGNGNRAAAFPALSGQWPEYTIAQLKAFRSGERNNDGESRMMRLTAMDLSDKEIEAELHIRAEIISPSGG